MFLLRHGQTEFNLHFTRTRRDPGIEDPPLTAHGRRQIREAGQALAAADIQQIIVSPYTRTLQSAAEIAAMFRAPIRVEPLVRERFAFTCDIGTGRAQLCEAWPDHDFAALDEIWWPTAFEEEQAVVARAHRFRTAMRREATTARILLVSHWGFLLALTGRSLENGEWMEWDPAEAEPAELVWQ